MNRDLQVFEHNKLLKKKKEKEINKKYKTMDKNGIHR